MKKSNLPAFFAGVLLGVIISKERSLKGPVADQVAARPEPATTPDPIKIPRLMA